MKRLVRINLLLKVISIGFESGSPTTMKRRTHERRCSTSYTGILVVARWTYFLSFYCCCLLCVCMCDHSYKSSYMFEIEMWKNMIREYYETKEQYLNVSCYF
jgi:hypothetical protein